MNIKRIVAVAVTLAGFLIAGIIFSGNESDGYSTGMDGKKVSLSDYEGSVVIINFWTTWCGPCRYEIPDLMELREKYDGDLVVLGISLDYDPSAVVPRFAERLGINYPILYGDDEIARTYGGVSGIPTTFIIDRDMNLYRRYIGYRPQSVFINDIEDLI